jgi:hypothetical protein
MDYFNVLGELFKLVNPLEIEAFLLLNPYVYNQLIALRGVLYERFGGQFALQVAETIDGEIIFFLFQPLYADIDDPKFDLEVRRLTDELKEKSGFDLEKISVVYMPMDVPLYLDEDFFQRYSLLPPKKEKCVAH